MAPADSQRRTPRGQRRAIELQVVPEHHLAAEILKIRVLDPPVAQRIVREIVHVLEDEQPATNRVGNGGCPRGDKPD
jgi:hypothetical protein